MKIRLVWVGKTKERFIRDGILKYLKLLRHYADIDVTEIREDKGKNVQNMIEKESRRILDLKIPFVLLDEKGKTCSSVEFASFINSRGAAVNFVLGGAYGVSESVRESALDSLALSRMTLTHEMSRLVLLEQIYRAFSIIHNRGYHH